MSIEVSSHSMLVQMVLLFLKFSCCSVYFGMSHLISEIYSHQLLVLIVPPTLKITYQVHELHMSIHSNQLVLPLPSQPTLASGYISRAKLFNILDNYVQKSEFPRLLDRYEKLKRKISRDSTAFEDDEYYQSVELLLLLIVLLWLVHDSCCVCFIVSFLLYLSLVPLIRRYYCMENVFVS